MAISSSKQKRLAARAAKDKKGKAGSSGGADAGPAAPVDGLALSQQIQAQADSERTASGVLTSLPQSRDLQIESYSLSFFGRVLIKNARVELNFGRRYGLVGQNGSGKSTFLRSLGQQDIRFPQHIDTYLLSEEAQPSDLTALQYVVKHAEEELERLEHEVESLLADEEMQDSPVLDDLYERIDGLDAATFEARAAELLHGLGFTKLMMAKQTRDLSGGWRMRVALAKALFIKPTLLLLDEPTNHLDLEACVWLEEFLRTYDRILVLISHSQDFLNTVCTNMIHLTPNQDLVYYGGNYDTFVRTKSEQEVNQMKAYDKQQSEIEHIKKFIASAGTYSNLVRQAKSKQKIIDKMEAAGLVPKVERPIKYTFRFSDVNQLSPPVLSFDRVTFAYDGNPRHALYRDVDLALALHSPLTIVGPNGTGKSTLLKLMTNDLEPTAGRVQKHNQVKISKYSQHSADQLDLTKSPVAYLRDKFGSVSQETDFWRQYIGRFGLSGNHQMSPIAQLSHGLRSRVVFCELALEHPHILLLDEPTNHLDIDSIDALADAIHAFNGGVVLVSHDFRLIGRVTKELWLVENKQINRFDGDIKDYKQLLRRRLAKQA